MASMLYNLQGAIGRAGPTNGDDYPSIYMRPIKSGIKTPKDVKWTISDRFGGEGAILFAQFGLPLQTLMPCICTSNLDSPRLHCSGFKWSQSCILGHRLHVPSPPLRWFLKAKSRKTNEAWITVLFCRHAVSQRKGGAHMLSQRGRSSTPIHGYWGS
jgi:hypothetical protein